MKIRQGFVSNSSSSSFTFVVDGEEFDLDTGDISYENQVEIIRLVRKMNKLIGESELWDRISVDLA